MNEKLNKLLFGAGVLGSLALGASSCSSNKSDDKEEAKTEVKAKEIKNDPYGNVALFEECKEDIIFALFFVENFYQYTYNDGCGNWTVADGLTVLYNEDGTSFTKVTKNTKPLTKEEAVIYTTRFLKYQILPIIENDVNVSLDKNSMITACVFGYCVGPARFKDSKFLTYLKTGQKDKLAKSLTRFRTPQGVLKRWYFFAALLEGKIQYSDLLNVRAEGCYNLKTYEIVVCRKDKNGKYIRKKDKYGDWIYEPEFDKNGCCKWIFKDIDKNLAKATDVKTTRLSIKGGEHVVVDCQLVKDIVPDYVWQDVSGGKSSKYVVVPVNEDETVNVDSLNDESLYAYQAENYDKALQDALLALKFAQTNKQRCAAHFNMGMAYMGKCKYGRAKDCFEKSLAENKTKAAQEQLNIAQEKLSEKRGKAGKVALGLSLLGAGAIYGGRKYYLMQQQKKGMRR